MPTAPTLTAYAGPADLQLYYDWREIGEVTADSNEPVSANDQLDPANLYGGIICRMLNAGAGEIEAALQVSGMYTVAQLQALTGNSKEKLIRANCQLAITYLYERKPFYNAEKLAAYRKVTEDLLDKLRLGVNVFNIAANITAGTPEVTGPSIIQNATSGLVAYKPGMEYFPVDRPIFNNG